MVAAQPLDSDILWPGWRALAHVDRDPERTEHDLALAAARGERDAFAELVRRHQRGVFHFCARLLRDRDEAADAAQEAFVRAYASMASFDADQAFGPWVMRIARNHCLDRLRRRLPAHRQVSLDAPPDAGTDGARELADARLPAADDRLIQAQAHRALDAAVAQLPERYQTVVTLFHQQHFTYQQIASTLGVPIGTVMTWLHRARAQLRQQLSAADEVGP